MRMRAMQREGKERVARAQPHIPSVSAAANPSGVTGFLLQLQRGPGNHYVQRWLGGLVMQRQCNCGGTCSHCGNERQSGSDAVTRLRHSNVMQARLTVSEPGDPFEQEADRVADQVMRMSEPETPATISRQA